MPHAGHHRGVLILSSAVKREIFDWAKTIALGVALALFVRYLLVEPYQVQMTSMEPNLHEFEHVFVNKLVYRLREPGRGDVVLVDVPGEQFPLIKRVIGEAGDNVEIRDGAVWINGQQLAEPYLQIPTLGLYGPVEVPSGTVFVLGDNRQNSRDSRDPTVGLVQYRQLRGKAMFVYWPLTSARLIPR